jgi:hypothetical protein
MAQRVRAFDWSTTPLGPMDRWPQSLRTAVDICLGSRLPMMIWWGPHLINLYNDAYAPVLGQRHPRALGMSGRELWADIWPVLGPQVELVMEQGGSTFNERVHLLVLRNGVPEDTWFTWSYSPIHDEDGKIVGLFNACQEDTRQVMAERERDRQQEERRRTEERAAAILDSVTDGFFSLDQAWRFTYANGQAGRILGRPADELIGKVIWDEYPGLHGNDLEPLYLRTMRERVSGSVTAFYPDHDCWYEVRCYPARDGLSVYFQNVTEFKQSEMAREALVRTVENERSRLRAVIEQAPAFICTLVGPDHVFELANDGIYDLLGKRDLIGKPVREALPELVGQPYLDLLDRVYTTGETFHGHEMPALLARRGDGQLEQRFVNFIYQPLREPGGEVTGVLSHGVDVTEGVQARRVLVESEARLRDLADAMPQIVWSAQPDGVLDYYNRRWFEYIGLPEHAAADAAWDRHVHPDDLPRVASAWSACMRSNASYVNEFRIRGAGGAYRWFLAMAEPVRDDAGAVRRWHGTCTDIEDRKRAEARDRFLLALDEAVRPLSDPHEITAAHARLLGEHLAADRCAYADVEHDQDTFNLTGDYNRGVPSIVGRYRFADFGAEVLRLMRAGEPYVVTDVESHEPPVADLTAYRATMIRAVVCVPICKDGRFVAAMAVHQASPRRWDADEVDLVLRVAGRCWESIERARVERSLRASERRFRDTADTAPAILWVTEADGRCSFLSRGWYELTGQAEADALGYGWANAAHPDDAAAARDAFVAANARQEAYAVDFRVRRADGAYRWVIDAGRPRFGADGAFLGFVGSVIDITDRKAAEEERHRLLESERAARAEAERAGRMKDEFLATLSHELRTPLNAVLGWSQVIRHATDADDLAQGLDVIERNARAQAQIIDDLLDMSRIISGKVRLDVQRLDLASIVEAAVETVRPTADAKGVRLRSVVDPLNGVVVSGDASRLQQVLWNLLTNAIKFTPRDGRVQVLLERVNSHLELSVIDTGEGIRPEFLPHVFDRFRQADASTTRRHGGLGLGLSIVKQLVELHGGCVTVRSAGLGQGSTFVVALPLTAVHAGFEPAATRHHPRATPAALAPIDDAGADVAGVRVLVVDDEPDARALVQRLLRDRGAVVAVAASAAEAMACLDGARFDVLVSDVGMPEADGYELIRRVRALGVAAGGNVPAIALTAYARAEDRVRAIAAGFQMHVTKPVEPVELLTMVASAAGRMGRARD